MWRRKCGGEEIMCYGRELSLERSECREFGGEEDVAKKSVVERKVWWRWRGKWRGKCGECGGELV